MTASTAVVWARCDAPGTLAISYGPSTERETTTIQVTVSPDHDYTGRVVLQPLRSAATYRFRVWCDPAADGSAPKVSRFGQFTTAPQPDQAAAVRFAWSGDLGGQNACRDAKVGYAIFDQLARQRPAFFIALGDMIYADDPCLARGRYGNDQIAGPSLPARSLRDFWAVWRYNRSDQPFQRFLDRTPILAVWDDHEIVNDSGPHRDTLPAQPDTHLLAPARQAFLDYQPLVPPADEPTRLYRGVRWGRHVEIFLLDARQYRDANEAPDDPHDPKTLLGAAQRDWFVRALTASDATWKLVVSSVPISIPVCSGPRGCDGWANHDQPSGFEHELRAILLSLRRAGVRNMVWLTTDVHFATAFRYTPFADAPDFQFVELVAGPLNAGVFPQTAFDLTLGTERLFFYGPTSPGAITSFAELRPWLNFGVIDVDAAGQLRLRIINGDGDVVAEQKLEPR